MDGNDNALQLLITNIQNAVVAINGLNVTLKTAFPQQGTTATTATAGSATLPATPQTFLNVTVSGTSYKVPLYLP